MSQRCLTMYRSKYSFLPSAVSLPSNPDTHAFSLLAVFDYAHKFNSDVSKWDVSKVSNMYRSKYSFLPSPAVSLPSNPDTRAFSLLAVFDHAYQFNSDVSKWDVSKVSYACPVSTHSFLPPLSRRLPILTRVPSLYLQCSTTPYQFNSDVSKWDVSKVSTMHSSKYSSFPHCLSSPSNPDTRAFSLFAVFYHAYQFNSNVSKWKIKNGTILTKCFIAHDLSTSKTLWINLGASKVTRTLERTCFREHAQGSNMWNLWESRHKRSQRTLPSPPRSASCGQNMPLLCRLWLRMLRHNVPSGIF